jgi:hypothetical protein
MRARARVCKRLFMFITKITVCTLFLFIAGSVLNLNSSDSFFLHFDPNTNKNLCFKTLIYAINYLQVLEDKLLGILTDARQETET